MATVRPSSTARSIALLALAVILGACGPKPAPPPAPGAVKVTPEEARKRLEELARADRERFAGKTFEQFRQEVPREPFEGGKYIVNGDTPILDDKHLEEFFDRQVLSTPPPPPDGLWSPELIVHSPGGVDAVWSATEKRALTYCVSTAFGARHGAVVAQMAAAGNAWEQVADVDFAHVASADAACDATTAGVNFDVRPVAFGFYLARAFFPNEPRAARNVLIDDSSFRLDPTKPLSLTGILRHELGHTLGFRHEHTRPASGDCFEDSDWTEVTSYDAFSVMHYPQCNGRGDWSLVLTAIDSSGAACVYGAAAGFTIDTAICQPRVVAGPPAGSVERVESFTGQSVAEAEENAHGPFAVVPGGRFVAVLSGPADAGDPDLYVQFGAEPTRSFYDCRPYLAGAEETCALDVPAGRTAAHVMVRGYQAGRYDLTVTFTAPAE